MTTRRNFLKASGLAGAAIIAGGRSAAADNVVTASGDGEAILEQRGPSNGIGIDGRILALGNLGYFRPDLGSKDVLSVLDLKDGTWRALPAGTIGGHLAQPLAGGGAVLMPRNDGAIEIRDSSLSSGRLIKVPGCAFSGHCFERNGELILAAERTTDKAGVLLRVAISTGEVLGETSSGGIHPHDIVAIKDNRIAVSHYGLPLGLQYGEGGGAPRFMFENAKPVVSVVDLKDMRVVKTIAVPGNFAATHLAAGSDGIVWMMPLQYRLLADHAEASGAVPSGITLRQDEWKSLRVAEGLPMVSIDPDSGDMESYDLGWQQQRRGQSIAMDEVSGKVFGAFPYSDTLWVHDRKRQETTAIRAFDLGIHAVRGVASIPGSGMIAICGEWEGVSIVDARSLKLVARYAMSTFWTAHIGVQARG